VEGGLRNATTIDLTAVLSSGGVHPGRMSCRHEVPRPSISVTHWASGGRDTPDVLQAVLRCDTFLELLRKGLEL
jgi:hypothetical protein